MSLLPQKNLPIQKGIKRDDIEAKEMEAKKK